MNNGHDIWQVPYAPALSGTGPIEVLTFAGLRRMDRAGRRRRVQRPEFHVLALVEAGTGRHRADFVDHPLGPGSIVWIRPGVVHQWTDVDQLRGSLLLFTAAVAASPDPLEPTPATWSVTGPAWALCRRAVEHLAAELDAAPPERSAAVQRQLLAALLLRVARTAPATAGDPGAPARIFHRFRSTVDEHFTTEHQVAWYARRLGYAPRTLTRATRAAVGVGAKRFLDERLALEAKRLLAHTDLTVAGCARRLGFDDPANFTTFFHRHVGLPPGTWRTTERGE